MTSPPSAPDSSSPAQRGRHHDPDELLVDRIAAVLGTHRPSNLRSYPPRCTCGAVAPGPERNIGRTAWLVEHQAHEIAAALGRAATDPEKATQRLSARLLATPADLGLSGQRAYFETLLRHQILDAASDAKVRPIDLYAPMTERPVSGHPLGSSDALIELSIETLGVPWEGPR